MASKTRSPSIESKKPKSIRSPNSFALLENLDEKVEAVSPRASAIVSHKEAVVRGEKKLHDPIVWVDLEMTGLNIEKDTILEIAVIITDGKLNHSIEGPNLAIHQDDDTLLGMDDWCVEHHGKSGLTDRCRASEISVEEAETRVLAFISQHTNQGWAPLAGNSIHVDRGFLMRFMPRVVDYLSFRIIDVSSLSELCKRWYPKEFSLKPRKDNNHTALADIRESIRELQFYRRAIFK